MSRGPGRLERFIMDEINRKESSISGEPMPVLVSSWHVSYGANHPVFSNDPATHNWKPSIAQRKAATRALRSFVRKHQQYALMGGQGRKRLYLYKADDIRSMTWAKLSSERRGHVPLVDVNRYLREGALR